MAMFKIGPDENTLHGFFSRDLKPILTIDSGDTVLFKTIEAEWGLENFSVTTFDPNAGPPPRTMAHTNIEGPKGHALCGPVYIRGAEPGMTLAIHIESILPGKWGWTAARGVFHLWELDPLHMFGLNQHGHQVTLRPFMGVMGMPPAEPGQHSTQPPRLTGGTSTVRNSSKAVFYICPLLCQADCFPRETGTPHRETVK